MSLLFTRHIPFPSFHTLAMKPLLSPLLFSITLTACVHIQDGSERVSKG